MKINIHRGLKQLTAKLLLLVFLLQIAGCGGGSAKATSALVQEKLELAVKLVAESKFDEAILAYQEVIKIDQKIVEAYQGLGKVYILQGKFAEAKTVYDQGIKVVSEAGLEKLYLGMAGTYVDQDNLPEAVKLYSQMIKDHPTWVEAYQGLALVYQLQGNQGEAEKILQQAVAANQDNVKALNNLAQFYLGQSNVAKAVSTLILSLASEVNQTDAYAMFKTIYGSNWSALESTLSAQKDQNLAEMLRLYALFDSGRFAEVLALYEQQFKESPQNLKAQVLAAMALQKSGDHPHARDLIDQVIASNPNPAIMLDLARYFLLTGDQEKAGKWARQSLEGDYQNLETINVLSEIMSRDSLALKLNLVKLIIFGWKPVNISIKNLQDRSLEVPFKYSSPVKTDTIKTDTVENTVQVFADFVNNSQGADLEQVVSKSGLLVIRFFTFGLSRGTEFTREIPVTQVPTNLVIEAPNGETPVDLGFLLPETLQNPSGSYPVKALKGKKFDFTNLQSSYNIWDKCLDIASNLPDNNYSPRIFVLDDDQLAITESDNEFGAGGWVVFVKEDGEYKLRAIFDYR